MESIINEMLMIDPVILAGIVTSTIVITKGITGTLKLKGWYNLYITISVYTVLLLAYIYRDNEIVRWAITYITGIGWATGVYNIVRKPDANTVTGGQTPIYIEEDGYIDEEYK